jgi:hypothetical protein
MQAISPKRLASFINFYLTRTVEFLNRFTSSVERQLFDAEHRLDRIDGALCLIEAKVFDHYFIWIGELRYLQLNSIPGLESSETIQKPSISIDRQDNNKVDTNTSVVSINIPLQVYQIDLIRV